MSKPKNCPKCGAFWDEITNVQDMCDVMGLDASEYKEWMCSKCNHLFNSNEAEKFNWWDERDFSKMTLSQLSDAIFSDWSDDISPQAHPYADAMRDLDDMNSTYGADSAEEIVARFLVNAKRWKGETAKKVKGELRRRLKERQ